jgi:pimeloyl-ACP methyl ester carboxylesterase
MTAAAHERRADVGGVPVRWLEQGSGTPVVLVHGIPTSPTLWRHVLPLLPDVRCLALEMVGFGESIPAGAGRDISLAAQAGYLLDWLEHLGVRRAVLVGHDLGGGVVHIAAVRRPDLVAGLLVTNGVGYDSWPIPSVKALRAAAPVLSRLPAPALLPALTTLVLRGHDDLGRVRESLPLHYGPYARHGGGAAMARQVQALDVRDTLAVQEALPSLDVPARVVWGAADAFQKIRYGERFASDLGAPLRRIEGGKHFVPEDHPDVLAAEILALVGEST